MMSFISIAIIFLSGFGLGYHPAKADLPRDAPVLFKCEEAGGTAYIFCHKQRCECPDIFFIIGGK